MKTAGMAVFGWLVPGGAYLLLGRRRRFAVFAGLVCATFAAGLALQGACQWPQAADVAGLGGIESLLARAGACARLLAGAPYLAARFLAIPGTFLDGRLHEYGTTLLTMAGLFNLLALAGALDLHKAGGR